MAERRRVEQSIAKVARRSDPRAEQKDQQETEPAAPRTQVEPKGAHNQAAPNHVVPNNYDPVRGRAAFVKSLEMFDYDFVWGIVKQVEELAELPDERNVLFELIKNVSPKTAGRILMAVQMGATHLASARISKQMRATNDACVLEVFERTNSKLKRTYMMQMDALEGGQPSNSPQVTVHNVAVNDGGQAIVGQVTQHHSEQSDKMTAAKSAPAAAPDAKFQATAPLNPKTPEPGSVRRRQSE